MVPQLIFGGSNGDVNFVAEDCKRNLCEGRFFQQVFEFLLCFTKTCSVGRVHKENDAIHFSKIIFPDAARGFMATKVKGPKANALDNQLFIVREQCWLVYGDIAIPQHSQKCGLSSIVKTQEAYFCIFPR